MPNINYVYFVESGVMFIEDTDGGHIDVAYKDWGYEAIEDEVKRLGVAMALRDIIVPWIKAHFLAVRSIDTDISERYGWVSVRMNIKISQGNRLKTL